MISYPMKQYMPALFETFLRMDECCSFNLENKVISRVQNND